MSENTSSESNADVPPVPPETNVSGSCPPQASHSAPRPPYPYQPVYYHPPQAKSGGCGRFFFNGFAVLAVIAMLGVGILFGGFFLFAVASTALNQIAIENEEKMVTEKFIAGDRDSESKVAVLTIDGVITADEDGFVAKSIRQVSANTAVKALVLRVDSPGGTMTGSDYYLHLLKKMKTKRRIPIVVSMGSIAASGGYYVAMAGDEILAEPATITGSIGVIASLFDASQLLDKVGVKSTPIVSGPYKAMGSFAKQMSDEEREIWQHLIDDNFDRFKEIIREGRKEFARNPEALDKLATGQIYTANEAVEHKLIDSIGFLDEAIERAAELADLGDDYQAVRYKPKFSFVETVLESRSPAQLLTGRTVSDVMTPRVYLLCPYVLPVQD